MGWLLVHLEKGNQAHSQICNNKCHNLPHDLKLNVSHISSVIPVVPVAEIQGDDPLFLIIMKDGLRVFVTCSEGVNENVIEWYDSLGGEWYGGVRVD